MQQSIVADNGTHKTSLKKALVLDDAFSDLPEACTNLTFLYVTFSISNLTPGMQVGNDQVDDIIEYVENPKTDFQCYIRRSRKGNYIVLTGKIYAHFIVFESPFLVHFTFLSVAVVNLFNIVPMF